MTDADKTGKPVGKHIENVSFLKRGLKYDRELRRYIAPISLKTIAKMLVVQVDSTLSESDHCSVAISNALREASLHPEPIFDQVMSRAVSAVADLGLSGNPNLDLTSYAVRRNQMREGTFSAWALPHRLQGLSTLSSAMNTVPIPSAPNSGAIASSDAGALSAPTSVTADPGAPVMPVVQLEENNLNDALTRFVQLGTYALSSTDATFSKTFEIRPLDLLLNNPLIVAKLNNFALMRADMEVVVMGTFPPGSYGLGEVSAYPTGGGAAYPGGDRANGLLSQRSLQPLKCREVDIHASMDYSSAESVSLVLPWFYPFDFAENPANKGAGAFGFTGMWDLVFTNLASVSTAVPGGVAHGQLTVFGRIRPGYVLSTPVMQGKRGHIAGAISKLSDAGAAAPKTGPVSSVAKVVSDVGSKLSALPFVGGVASAVSGVADVVGNIAAFFGYSKTAAEPALVTTQNTNWNNFATLDGTESAYNAQLIPGIQIGGGPELVGQDGEDVASFPSLFKRWVALASISWNTQSNDTRLYHCDVTPSLVSSLDGASLCTGGFIGLPFANWRGDMEYCVEVVCSPLHRGTIQAAWVPFGTAWSTGDPTNTALNHVWDIEPGKRKIIRVPYARAEPYMANLPYSMATAVIPSGAANGTFFLRVVNPLQTQVSGQSVTVLVWYRCAENMDFRVPRESINNLLLAVPAVSPMTDVRLQGLGDADVVDEEVVVFGSSGDYAPDMVNFPGTGVRSVRALMQKPSRLFLNSTFITAYNTFKGTLNARIPVLGFLPSSAVSSGSFDNMWTWVGHYRGMFAAVATSERIGILTTIGCTSGAARVTAVSGAGAYGAAGCVLMPFQLGDGG